jgi:hypothetical protein
MVGEVVNTGIRRMAMAEVKFKLRDHSIIDVPRIEEGEDDLKLSGNCVGVEKTSLLVLVQILGVVRGEQLESDADLAAQRLLIFEGSRKLEKIMSL